ncbi:crooked neck protein [Naegleria gruberi]|uniref:Crooked neck protein n=1 Tax=Naegleria gruberi TaxID=5762 RepID=D2UY76_NAEGR|nr:crooked neck protein [Naegleria gruberi]EFC50747.1 crooked neck protein [Naegleria gruberi]|eukprot:XP_002683491.1 crooked neck protein [Naegleria gruberi strain NEG-M]
MNDIQQRIERQQQFEQKQNEQEQKQHGKKRSRNDQDKKKDDNLPEGYSYNYGNVDRSRSSKVKDKRSSQLQITAEQIIREAFERSEKEIKAPKQDIKDMEELEEFRLRMRKQYEDTIRKNRHRMTNYIKYAQWEENQKQIERARSIFERALDVNYREPIIWLKYAEMEMRNKFINHARNIWDRAVSLLPRTDQFWYKYIHMEEMMKNINAARQLFERWMEWQPDEKGWKSYISFELRYGEVEKARKVNEKFIRVHPDIKTWLYYAKFEQKYGGREGKTQARLVFERATTLFDLEVLLKAQNFTRQNLDEVIGLYIAFADFEVVNGEVERANSIYKYLLDRVTKDYADVLYQKFVSFQKQFGDTHSIENVIYNKKRFDFENDIKENPNNYDVWIQYLTMAKEQNGNDNLEETRDLFERAISNVPPLKEKRYWKRYIYIWINYAIFEEITTKNITRARQVYQGCLELLANEEYSSPNIYFSKIWIMFAHFEIRQHNMDEARKILDTAISIIPKDRIFKEYIKVELSLGNIDSVRHLFQKQLEVSPSNCEAWKNYAELEQKVKEIQRTRAIYELAVSQPNLDMPELIWKCYIDFEIEQKEYEKVRLLYKRLLEKTKHVKVWLSYALFEKALGSNNFAKTRQVYEDAYTYLKKGSIEEGGQQNVDDQIQIARREQRYQLLISWLSFEQSIPNNQDMIEKLNQKKPTKIRKKRKIFNQEGEVSGYTEYADFIFKDDEDESTGKKSNLKILEKAMLWKKEKEKQK